jgi:mannose-1-phosphate guanylyltransferase
MAIIKGFPPQAVIVRRCDDTMLQATVKRTDGLDVQSSVAICNEDHRFFVAEQLRETDKFGSTTLEPAGRNTALFIALAAFFRQR